MIIHRIMVILLAVHANSCIARVYAFPEQYGVVVKFVSPDEHTPLFYTKGLNVTQDFKHGYMTTAQYFHKKGFCPVGIIVHNKGDAAVKINAASLGSQQCAINDVMTRCLGFEGFFGWLMVGGFGAMWTGALQSSNNLSGHVVLFLLAISALCITGGFAVDGVFYYRDYDARAQVLAGCVLNEDIIIKPGQKIIKYVLLDRYKDGADRTDAGGLKGLEFTVFNGDNTPRVTCTAQGAR